MTVDSLARLMRFERRFCAEKVRIGDDTRKTCAMLCIAAFKSPTDTKKSGMAIAIPLFLARLMRFERTTFRLGGGCSILLSYRRISTA